MQTILLVSLVVFLVLLIVLERLHSIKIIIRFGFSLAIIYGFIKAIGQGKSIVLFSCITVFLLSVVNIFIKNGFHRRSISELISVLLTSGITSFAIFLICKFSGPKVYQDEIQVVGGVKNPENAVFSVFIIGTLGIYMDIISRIIFQLNEKKDKTVDTPWKEQFKEGIEIGRFFVSEKINLVVLILLGGTLFPICSDLNRGARFIEVWKEPNIFVYCLIAIIANIGLVLSVIITAFMFASFNRKKTIYKTVSDNKIDGKRSLKL